MPKNYVVNLYDCSFQLLRNLGGLQFTQQPGAIC